MMELKNSPKIITLVKTKFTLYLPLIKSLQTGLLLITGLTGYMSARCPVMTLDIFLGLIGSLFSPAIRKNQRK